MCAMPKIVSVPKEFVAVENSMQARILHDASALREVLQRISGNSGRGQGWANDAKDKESPRTSALDS